MPVKGVPDVSGRVTATFDRLDHAEYSLRGSTVQWAGESADPRGDARGDVGSRRGDHPRRERGGVHAVLGGRDEVGVHGLDVAWVGVAAPALHEALDDRARLVDLLLWNRGEPQTTGR